MNASDFAYWLQGFAELNDAPPSKAQWKSIREHLGLVFEKRTPAYGNYAPNQSAQADFQKMLQQPGNQQTAVMC